MPFKKDYLNHKISYWKNLDRDSLANLEFLTLTYLLKIFFNYELKKSSRVLDLGSGDQFLKKEFVNRGIEYLSLDINEINFEKDKFNLASNNFDLIISLAVIEHLKNPDIFLDECKRVLKQNSFLFLSTPNWQYCVKDFFDDVTHVKPYTPNSLNDILSIKNFKDILIIPSLRCKSKWWYQGRFKFFKAYYLLPFTNEAKFVPKFLKGKSRGMFAIAKK